MGAEMPKKYWRNLPESRLIGDLVRDAQKAQRAAPAGTRPSMSKARHLVARQRGTAPLAGPLSTAQQLAMDIARCERCTLHQCATQAVPGIGPDQARLVLVGEQPGDQEDLVGKPFVGPAGQTLDRALHAAGIDRKAIYLTNAVKHFKYEVRGRRRLHSRPNAAEIEHCRWWLGQELALIKPQVTVALGATAARALLGRPCRVQDLRGQVLHDDDGRALLVTVHPAYLLRLGNAARAATEFERFVADLDAARTLAASAAESVL